MKVIKNALATLKKMPSKNAGPRTEQGKTLLKLKSGEGFSTTLKKAMGLRILAKKNNLTITVRSTGSGKCLICRL